MTHEIRKSTSAKHEWAYCLDCGRDVNHAGTRHYKTSEATIAKRLGKATA